MPISKEDGLRRIAETILEQAKELVDMARSYKNQVKNLSDEDRAFQLDGLQDKLDLINSGVTNSLNAVGPSSVSTTAEESTTVSTRSVSKPSEDEGGTTFADFLSKIGNSVVKSQEQLDKRSIDYLKSIQDRPYIPPTLFRIPKIAASLKVGLEEKTKTGLNVLLFSHKTEMSELNQQSINFEIAAVPPTPELLQMLHDQTPRIDFLFDRERRRSLFDVMKAFIPQQTNDSLKKQLARILVEKNQPQTIIWTINPDKSYLILFAGEESGKDVGIWFLDQEQGSMVPVLRLDLKPKSGEDQAPLRKFVFDLGQTQAKLLVP